METNWDVHWKRYVENGFLWKLWVWRAKGVYGRLLRYTDLKNPTILELGSGSGKNSLILARTLNARKVVLVDSNDASLRISQKVFQKSGINVKFLKEDVLELSLKKKYDLVHSEGLIEHFYGEDRASVFKKHVDCCRKGGFVIILVPCHTLLYILLKGVCQIFGWWIYEEQEFTREELRGLCRQFNLRILKEIFLFHEIGIVAKLTEK